MVEDNTKYWIVKDHSFTSRNNEVIGIVSSVSSMDISSIMLALLVARDLLAHVEPISKAEYETYLAFGLDNFNHIIEEPIVRKVIGI